jgi:lipopolysaccharide export LptBFGC system permease protein LptF
VVASALILPGSLHHMLGVETRQTRYSRGLGLPSRYARYFFGGILSELSLLLLLIESVFLGEALAGILESGINDKMGFGSISMMLACTAPKILAITLPPALLFAVFRVILRLREGNELVIIASAGTGIKPLLVLLVGIAFATQLVSLAISGFVAPYSRYLQRVIEFNSAYGELLSGSATGEFDFPNDYVVFAKASTAHSSERSMFLEHPLDQETNRLVIARRFRLDQERSGWFDLRLQQFAVYDFPAASWLTSNAATSPVDQDKTKKMLSMKIGNYAQELSINHLIYFAPRNSLDEQTLPELFAHGYLLEGAQCVFRSFFCLIAPLLALMAVALTGRNLQVVTLPFSLMALMGLDVTFMALLDRVPLRDVTMMCVILAAATLALFIILGYQVISWQDRLLKSVAARL